jgi:hypothetical protein
MMPSLIHTMANRCAPGVGTNSSGRISLSTGTFCKSSQSSQGTIHRRLLARRMDASCFPRFCRKSRGVPLVIVRAACLDPPQEAQLHSALPIVVGMGIQHAAILSPKTNLMKRQKTPTALNVPNAMKSQKRHFCSFRREPNGRSIRKSQKRLQRRRTSTPLPNYRRAGPLLRRWSLDGALLGNWLDFALALP